MPWIEREIIRHWMRHTRLIKVNLKITATLKKRKKRHTRKCKIFIKRAIYLKFTESHIFVRHMCFFNYFSIVNFCLEGVIRLLTQHGAERGGMMDFFQSKN